MNHDVAGRTGRPGSANNLRTAVVLLSIALVFFAGVIAKYWFA